MKLHPSKPLTAACPEWAVRLATGHPDDLSPDDRVSLQSHIRSCPDCAAVYTECREVDERIHSLPVVQPSAWQVLQLEALIKDRIPEESMHRPVASVKETRSFPTRPRTRRGLVGSRLSALAALLIVALLSGGALMLFSSHHSSTLGGAPGTLYTISYSDGTAYALNTVTGKIEWRTPLHIKPDEAVLISHGVIFITSQDGFLYAVRTSDGQLLWHRSYKAISSVNGRPVITPSLVSDGAAVYIGAETGLYAWSVSDGHTLWYHAPPLGCDQSGITPTCDRYPITASNGIVYVYFDGLYALRSTNGATLWHDQRFLPGSEDNLVVVKNHLYVAPPPGNAVFVLQADNGHPLDTIPVSRASSVQLMAAGDMVYVNSGIHDVYAVRSSDDRVLWHNHYTSGGWLMAADDGNLYYEVTVARSSAKPTHILQVELSVRIYVINATNGALRSSWQYPAGSLAGSVAVSPGILYISNGLRGGLYALNSTDGKIIWHALPNTWLARVVVE